MIRIRIWQLEQTRKFQSIKRETLDKEVQKMKAETRCKMMMKVLHAEHFRYTENRSINQKL